MDIIELGKVILENVIFMHSIRQQIGEPTQLNSTECEKVFEDLQRNPMMSQKFVIVCNVKKLSIDWQFQTNRFVKIGGQLTLIQFFRLLHPNFMADFIRWGQATYSALLQYPEMKILPLQQYTRIDIPLKLIDGKYYWVTQEAIPLQIDANGKLVSHLNIYSILYEMTPNEDVKLIGRLYNHGFEIRAWSQMVWKTFLSRRPFVLTPEQIKIVTALNQNIQLSNSQLATILQKQKNTIDIHHKNILARAREAFPNQPFHNVKEVVCLLQQMGYFNDGNENLPEW